MLNSNTSCALSTTSPWQDCLSYICAKIGPASFETWFRSTELSLPENGGAEVQVPNRFFADFIEEHFTAIVKDALSASGISPEPLRFTPVLKDWRVIEPIQERIAEAKIRQIPTAVEQSSGKFHHNYVFERFVVGDSNRMAHAAALAVAEAPGKTTFNPLIVYGGTGLGKTHLLQSIGHFAQTYNCAEHAVYMTSEEFCNQYIGYVVDKKDSTSFYKKFWNVDLLLIDDIQFFGGKPGTQKEFFRVFNKLLMENKQIVLSSDRPPEQIPDMMQHIINRFMGGLITDIQPPNLETRMAILRKKAETDGLFLPSEVLEYIAGHITSNVRELEGILVKLIASSSFTGRDITLDITRELLGDVLIQKGQRLTIKHIQQKVADHFGISPNQLTAHSRKRDVTIPRYVAMYLAKKWTSQSLRSIGLEFGNRDYSTVIHASKRIEEDVLSDMAVRRAVEDLEDVLRPLA
jgi:chromosomal replication initiator protein